MFDRSGRPHSEGRTAAAAQAGTGQRGRMTSSHETERKYVPPAGRDLPDWSRAAGADATVDLGEQTLHAVYFDTANLDLLRHRVTLRHRTGGATPSWTLKLPVGDDTREEIRIPGERDRLWTQRPPSDLTALVRAYTRGRPVDVVANLVTRRRRTMLLDVAGETVAEVDDDLVSAVLTGDVTPTGWREIEVELSEGVDVDTLDRIERHLLDAGLERAASTSKLGRALAERMAPPARRRGRTAGDVVLDRLADQVERLRQWDSQVRLERDDAVHQMRVCCRRLRSVLQAYAAVLDREHTAALVEKLRWLGDVLGVARDLEVLRARFTEAARQADLDGERVAQDLERYFAVRQDEARCEVLAALDSDQYLELLAALDALLETPPLTEKAWKPAGAVLAELLARSARRVARHLRAAVDDDPTNHDTELHEARKAAKRLRYAAEVAVPALGHRAARLAGVTRRVQDILGERQDAVVARPVLREIAAGSIGHDAFGYGVLYEREASSIRAAEDALPAAWRAARRRLTKLADGR